VGEEQRIEAAAVGDVDAAVLKDLVERIGHLEEQSRVAGLTALRDEWQPTTVKIVDQQPAPGLERCEHLRQRASALGQMREHQARVHEIEASFVELVVDDVMTAKLDIRCRASAHPAGVDVSHEHGPSGTDALAEPCPATLLPRRPPNTTSPRRPRSLRDARS
jgi:hypothetical protein